MSTGSSRAALGTTCLRKPRRAFAEAVVEVDGDMQRNVQDVPALRRRPLPRMKTGDIARTVEKARTKEATR